MNKNLAAHITYGTIASFLLTGCGGLIPFPMVETVPIPPTKGRIVDVRNGAPISGAHLMVRGHIGTATTSDDKGEFITVEGSGKQFSFLSAGYTTQRLFLIISKDGYTTAQVPWIRPPLLGYSHEIVRIGDVTLAPRKRGHP
ncbi:MAG: hypothetical protein WCD79_22120 [Chthoniobacteraceae bacterium]